MGKKPCALLSDSKRPANLTRADAVLGVHDQPEPAKPLVQGQRTIFKDAANLDGELLPAFFAHPKPPRKSFGLFAFFPALANVLDGDKISNLIRSASW